MACHDPSSLVANATKAFSCGREPAETDSLRFVGHDKPAQGSVESEPWPVQLRTFDTIFDLRRSACLHPTKVRTGSVIDAYLASV